MSQTDVLVDRFSRARVADFTFATIDLSQGTLEGAPCSAMVISNLPARWTAPEVLKEKGPPSKKSDVFSFAMVMYEVGSKYAVQRPPTDLTVTSTKVFAGEIPFEKYPNFTTVIKITDGDRPGRPANPLLTDDVWELMQKCWGKRAHLRPEMSKVLTELTPSLFKTLHQLIESLPELQVALSQFYDSTERKTCIDRLRNAELKKFIDLLDDVSQLYNPFRPRY